MLDAAPDGLASLSAQRKRARRSMPPPRHPIAADSAQERQEHAAAGHASEPLTAAAPLTAVPAVSGTDVKPASTGRAAAEPALPASRGPGVAGAPVKVTLYVNQDSDEFMETVRVEGLTARPKVDVSRSAVVRLALRRLMNEMSAADVKALLERQEVRSSGPGRKRR